MSNKLNYKIKLFGSQYGEFANYDFLWSFEDKFSKILARKNGYAEFKIKNGRLKSAYGLFKDGSFFSTNKLF